LLFKDWKEIFTGEEIGKHGFPGYVQKCFEAGRFLNSYTQILAEEYVLDYDESNLIPLDYKAWCFNGLCAYIQVISRNGLKRRWSSCFYDRNGCVVDDPIQCSYEHVKKPLPHDPTFQQYWGNLIEQVESISKYLAHFMRIDFYISKSGPVFGEFTSYPFAGQNYSDKGSKVLNSLFFLLSNGMSEIDAA
jgi:hypothetical protein